MHTESHIQEVRFWKWATVPLGSKRTAAVTDWERVRMFVVAIARSVTSCSFTCKMSFIGRFCTASLLENLIWRNSDLQLVRRGGGITLDRPSWAGRVSVTAPLKGSHFLLGTQNNSKPTGWWCLVQSYLEFGVIWFWCVQYTSHHSADFLES